jgi:hypothetical protein
MNIHKKFKDMFYILSDDHENVDILIFKLQKLYDNNIIDIEILLNIIKGLILLLSIDNRKLYDYINIFDYFLNLNDKNILNNFAIIDFSKQFKVSEEMINKIIINTDYIVNNIIDTESKNILIFLFNIVKKIIKLNVSVNNKIYIYNIYTDDVINNLNTKNINYHNMKFNELINNITRFIK